MPTGNKQKKFSFVSNAVAGNTFNVVRVKGEEGLSTLYQFEIELVALDSELAIDEVIQNPACFKILRDRGEIQFHGMLYEFEQHHQNGNYCFYRAVLVPRLWWLSRTRENQVFLDTNTPDIIREVLKSADFTEEQDFSINLEKENNYPDFDYVCQYNESHLDFIKRLMEREGIYYYFEQTGNKEKLIITDTLNAHTDMEEGSLLYAPPSGMNEADDREVVRNFSCRQQIVPASVVLKTYNWEKRSTELECSAEVFEEGRGSVYIYGDSFKTQEDGHRLAGLRAQELNCWRESFFGDSSAPSLRPGYTFELEGHFRKSFNKPNLKYLIVGISHEGTQPASLLTGFSGGAAGPNEQSTYNNSFTALPSTVQFRPQRRTEKPRIHGTLNAEIDAPEDGSTPKLNENGCYKVKMPFDRAARQEGKASAWIRMMRPYAGADHGTHFPLHKGTEVLISFINGDPDQPVIAGAVANTNNADVVNNENETQCRILTSGKNKIEFEDKKDQEQILIESPYADSLLKLGYPREDKEWYEKMGFEGIGGWIGKVADPIGTLVKAGIDGGQYALGDKDLGMDSGIELRTSNGLKIASTKKEESVGAPLNPGYSALSVTGSGMSSVLGLAMDNVTGMRMVSTRGYYSNQVIGGKDEKVYGPKHLLNPFTFLATANKTEAAAVKEELSEQVTELSANQTNLNGQVEELQAKVAELEGSKEELSGSVNELKGKTSYLEGATQSLIGDQTELTGKVTSLEGETSQMSGKVQNLEGSVTNLKGDVTNLEGNMVRLSTSCAEVSGTKTMV